MLLWIADILDQGNRWLNVVISFTQLRGSYSACTLLKPSPAFTLSSCALLDHDSLIKCKRHGLVNVFTLI